jgi:DNA polymerase elongation subunit (family B)
MLYDSIMPFAEKEKVDFKILLTDTDSLYIEWDFSNSKFKNYYEFIQELSNETKSLICIHSLSAIKKEKRSRIILR